MLSYQYLIVLFLIILALYVWMSKKQIETIRDVKPVEQPEIHIIPSEDCIWNGTCRIPPNNDSFWAYEPARDPNSWTSPLKLKCNQSDTNPSCPCSTTLSNCSNIMIDEKCFTNKSCPCQAINYGGRKSSMRCISGPLGVNF